MSHAANEIAFGCEMFELAECLWSGITIRDLRIRQVARVAERRQDFALRDTGVLTFWGLIAAPAPKGSLGLTRLVDHQS